MSGELGSAPLLEFTLRLGAAIVIGGAIGLNRDLRNKPAGVRTHALVALAAALLPAIILDSEGDPANRAQMLSRAVQGIITGIGFLGAGVILHPSGGRTVRGLTTAATIWVTAALGITCGMGSWKQAALATVLTFAVLLLGGPIERLGHRLVPGSSGGTDADES